MNGVSATTATTALFLRIQRVEVKEVGTYSGTNSGTIDVRVSGGGNVHARIIPGDCRSGKSHYTIPNGKTGFLVYVNAQVESTKTATIALRTRIDADTISAPFAPGRLGHHWHGVAEGFIREFLSIRKAPEKTDVWFTAIPGAMNTLVDVMYDVILIDN
jgi:hypothetical protein